MTEDPRPEAPSDAVVRRVREIRKRRGWSAARLAAECAKVGASQLTESIIANLEAGRRQQGVTVDELLVLAVVLNVAPVHLLVPPEAWDEQGGEVPYPITPTRAEQASTVREWVRGMPLPGTDLRDFLSQVPEHELRDLVERVAGRDLAEQEPEKED